MAYDNLFSGLLIQTCVVYRRQQVHGEDKKDAFNQPTSDLVEVDRFKCRCSVARGGRSGEDRMQDVVQTTHKLFLEASALLYENDEVTVLQPGASDSGPMVVNHAVVNLVRPIVDGAQLHHIEADLTMQRAATGVSTPNG